MSTRNTDVSLIIRAKSEADAALNAVADALQSLVGDAGDANSRVSTLAQTLAALDKASGAIAGSVTKAGAAYDRQTASVAENRAALAALVAQQSEARQALEAFGNQSDKAFVGPRTNGFTKNYEAVRSEADRLQSVIDKLTRTISGQESALNGAQSSLVQLSATSRAIADAQAEAQAQILQTTAAIEAQAAAGTRRSPLQENIDNLTGVNRPNASGSAAAAADVLLEADNIFRRAEARAAEIQKLREQEAALADLARTQEAEKANRERFAISDDPSGKQARESAAVFEEAAVAEAQMAREANELRAALNPLGAVQEKLNAKLTRYRELAAAGAISTDELAAAEKRLQEAAAKATEEIEAQGEAQGDEGAGLSLFGLRPYELQNLSYQINDIFTQLASGTSLTQTLSQQIGQIFQLFPRVGGAIIAAFSHPGIIAFAVILAGVVLGLKEAFENAEKLRAATADLGFRANGALYDPQTLVDQQSALEALGASAEDAESAFKSFLDNGIAPEKLEQFARAAQDTADALGTELPDAAKEVAEAFTAGYEAVAEFDDKLNFLTGTQREQIRTLFEQGKADEARSTALAIYSKKSAEVAEQSRGPWASATRELGTAFSDFLDLLGNLTPIRLAVEALESLGLGIQSVIKQIKDGGEDAERLGEIAQARLNVADAKRKASIIKEDPATQARVGQTIAELGKLVDAYNEVAKAKKGTLLDRATGLPTIAGDTVSNDANSVRVKKRNDRLAELRTEEELQRLRDLGSRRVLNAAETARRAELAGVEAAKGEADEVIALSLRRAAIAKEIAAIEKSNDAERKKALTEREQAIKQFLQRAVAAEGGTAKNPNSSAKGFGQFIDSTFLDVYKRTPGADQSLSREQILALRNNERVARGVLDQYARENARFLERFGAQVTAGNLYLAHFLGPAGAKKVLTADGATPVDQLLPQGVLDANQGYLRTSKKGRYRTADELETFIAGRVGDTGSAQSGLVEEQARIQQANVDRQENLNRAVRQGNEDRQRTVDSLKAQSGLSGVALIAEERRQALAKAELDLRQQVENANRNLKPGEAEAVVTDAQITQVRELEAALFDAARARDVLAARRDDVSRPVDGYEQQLQLLREQADFLRSAGDLSGAQQVEQQITAVSLKLNEAIDKLIAFYRALSPEERVQQGIIDEQQLDNIIAKLEAAKNATQQWGKIAGVSSKDIAQAFASSATGAVTNFLQKVADGENVFKAFGDGILSMAANFASAIAQMILQLLAYAAAVTILRALGVPVPGGSFLGGGGSASVKHGGGLAGSPGVSRPVNPAIFAGAMRLHSGGIPGLGPNEVATILEKDEEVLTSDDPRHRWNMGGGGGGESSRPQDIKIVNTIDAGQMQAEAMQTRTGQRAVLNFIQANKQAVKSILSD